MSVSYGLPTGSKTAPTLYIGKPGGGSTTPTYGYVGKGGGASSTFLAPAPSSPPASPPASPPPPSSPPSPQAYPVTADQTHVAGPPVNSSYTYSASCSVQGASDSFNNKQWSASDGTSGTGWTGSITFRPAAQASGTTHNYTGTITFTGYDGTTSYNGSATSHISLNCSY